MDKREEFDLDFDFEKEYGFDPGLMDNNYRAQSAEPPVLNDDAPVADFSESPQTSLEDMPEYGTVFEAPAAEYDEQSADAYDQAPMEELPQRRREKRSRRSSLFHFQRPSQPEMPAPISDEEPIFDESPVAEPVDAPMIDPAAEPIAELTADVQPDAPRPEQRRRRKRTKEQIFKEVYLPPIIAGTALLLILIMVIGAIVRAVGGGGSDRTGKENSEEQAALDAEAENLMTQAELLAAGYDYNAAIALLDTFSGEQSAYPEMLTARSSYVQAQSQLIEWRDPASVPNLSFHVLIADPSRAFTNESFGKNYNKNFVTTDEFEKILQQLYDNNYVLVGLEDVVFSTTTDNTTTYTANTIYLPDGKKPIMITETMVNYYSYMVDSDKDGSADAGGAGFASKLVLDENGEITAQMVTASGETVQGNYDLVPILNDFIEQHPDFSYHGARAILAVSGYDGIFGYRTQKGDANEIAAAKDLVAALREDGYTIACYSYSDMNYAKVSATEIQADLQKWNAEVTPILGNVDVLVYAKATDISDYTGNQYNVLYNAGFRYFIGTGTTASAKVTDEYFHQRRIMVTGTQMAHGSTVYSAYFNAMAVLNTTRGNVPQ